MGESRTRRDQLRLYDRLRDAALFEFLLLAFLGALLLPILVAVPQRGHEGEARRSPKLNRRERECGRKIERDRQNVAHTMYAPTIFR